MQPEIAPPAVMPCRGRDSGSPHGDNLVLRRPGTHGVDPRRDVPCRRVRRACRPSSWAWRSLPSRNPRAARPHPWRRRSWRWRRRNWRMSRRCCGLFCDDQGPPVASRCARRRVDLRHWAAGKILSPEVCEHPAAKRVGVPQLE